MIGSKPSNFNWINIFIAPLVPPYKLLERLQSTYRTASIIGGVWLGDSSISVGFEEVSDPLHHCFLFGCCKSWMDRQVEYLLRSAVSFWQICGLISKALETDLFMQRNRIFNLGDIFGGHVVRGWINVGKDNGCSQSGHRTRRRKEPEARQESGDRSLAGMGSGLNLAPSHEFRGGHRLQSVVIRTK